MSRTRILSNAALTLAVSLSLISCKETLSSSAPSTETQITDSSYTAAVETPQARRVLIEEFTGVSCPPCPKGHLALTAILTANASADGTNKVSVLGIQSMGIPQAEPVNDEGIVSKHDNRTADGTEIYNSVYKTFGSIPRAGIDRVPVDNALSVSRDLWSTRVNARLAVATPVNITLTRTYDENFRRAIVKVHIAYTGDLAKRQKLTLAIIENDIIDAQKNDLEIDSAYVHEHVLRDILTDATGTSMLGTLTTKKAGQVYESTFAFTLNDAWVPENCKVVAFVSNDEGTDNEVQQVAEISLK